MHGMLSASVMLAAFAVIALAAAASVVWLYRAAGVSPQRSRPVPAGSAGLPGDAADPDTPADPELARPGTHDGLARPDDGAAQRVAMDVYDVYDVEDWAGTDPDRLGPRGLGAWPNPSSSLYSRGWPAMDSSRAAREPAHGAESQEMNGQVLGGHGGHRPEDTGEGWDGRSPEGQDRGEPDRGEPDRREPDRREADSREADEPQSAAPVRPEGARVYVLGESRRRGR